MVKHVLLILLFLVASLASSQETNQFETIFTIKTTALKDQQSSGTCWSFATTSFIETEALRLGKDSVSLSPIFYVAPTYMAKAETFIDKAGASYFAGGDLTFSVLDAYSKYGAIPEIAFNGIIEDDWQHDHLEMDKLLFSMVNSIGTSGYGRIKPHSWRQSIFAVLQAYLGSPPTMFVYKDEIYSPQSFAVEHVGINPTEYVEITSFSHHKFYQFFDLDIPANWNNNVYLNLPLSQFEQTIEHALNTGYSLAWDGDATEPNFDFEKGILKLPDEHEKMPISQEARQSAFEDNTTTDDHNMHIIGKAKNRNGDMYYILKNSEGSNDMNGYIYMSKNALLLKTISVLVHKDGIPETIQEKSHIIK